MTKVTEHQATSRFSAGGVRKCARWDSNVGGPVIPPTWHDAHQRQELRSRTPKSDYSADMGQSLAFKAMSDMSAI
jgi:hypothetical protein